MPLFRLFTKKVWEKCHLPLDLGSYFCLNHIVNRFTLTYEKDNSHSRCSHFGDSRFLLLTGIFRSSARTYATLPGRTYGDPEHSCGRNRCRNHEVNFVSLGLGSAVC